MTRTSIYEDLYELDEGIKATAAAEAEQVHHEQPDATIATDVETGRSTAVATARKGRCYGLSIGPNICIGVYNE